jgi:hypothetical protein
MQKRRSFAAAQPYPAHVSLMHPVSRVHLLANCANSVDNLNTVQNETYRLTNLFCFHAEAGPSGLKLRPFDCEMIKV